MVNAPFRECVVFSLGDPNVFVRRIICPCLWRVRSKRFCAEDRGFLSEADFQSRHSLRLPLSLVLTLVAMVTGTVGSPLVCRFRGMSFVCMTRSVLVSTVRTLDQRCVGGSVARGFFFLSVFVFVLRLL